ncbi:hypothetical protein TNCV_983781 [Trichonephila clavipes]|nr:hypothetical protein TNCV_983781 [Trichonephila clavipes]
MMDKEEEAPRKSSGGHSQFESRTPQSCYGCGKPCYIKSNALTATLQRVIQLTLESSKLKVSLLPTEMLCSGQGSHSSDASQEKEKIEERQFCWFLIEDDV